MATQYEWIVEELEGEDIVNVNHWDTYAEALKGAEDLGPHRIGLVRESGGYLNWTKAWAYVVDGVLPADMLDAYDNVVTHVPKKYRDQFAKA